MTNQVSGLQKFVKRINQSLKQFIRMYTFKFKRCEKIKRKK
jgi:hypothetical protein